MADGRLTAQQRSLITRKKSLGTSHKNTDISLTLERTHTLEHAYTYSFYAPSRYAHPVYMLNVTLFHICCIFADHQHSSEVGTQKYTAHDLVAH